MIKLMLRILNVAGKYRNRIWLAAVCSFVKAFFSKAPLMAAFYLIAAFIDGSISGMMCLYAGLAVVACIALQCVFQNLADRLQSASGYMIFADMRMRLGAHLRKLPMGYFTEGNIGNISSVLSTDMQFIEENCMMVLADMMGYLFAGAIFVIFMFFFDVRMGLLSLVVSLIFIVVGELMKKDTMAHSDARQAASRELTDAVIDFTEGIGIIKTFNMIGEKSKELGGCFENSCEKNIRFELDYAPWSRAINLTYGLGSVAVLVLSWQLYQNGTFPLAYFVGMTLFLFEMFSPLKAFYGQVARLTVMNSCMDRIEALFDETELSDEGTKKLAAGQKKPKEAAAGRGSLESDTYDTGAKNTGGYEIEFKNVGFAYDEREVLSDVSFTVENHTMTALVGPSGGGKSTIASLLPRFWDVKKGQIRINGTDIRELPMAELMDHISMVFQRVYLFRDTIYNNIVMGRPDAAREEVMEAAKKARCYDFIMQLPDGFDTVIGEGGASLSGGEQQRISIARCILKDAPIVILDEATASVDADNERYIQEAISELCRGKTLLVIAHRLNTIRNAAQILVISDGKVRGRGTHEELMNAGGIYHDMVVKRNAAVSLRN